MFVVKGVHIPNEVLPVGYDGDTNYKVTDLFKAAQKSLYDDKGNVNLARSMKLKSVIHDATSHQGKEYIALGVRHLNAARTRPVNTFVALDTVPRKDAHTQALSIASMIFNILFKGPPFRVSEDTAIDNRVAAEVWPSVILSIGRDGWIGNNNIDNFLNEWFGICSQGIHCSAHRAHLATTRNTKKPTNAQPKCKPIRDQQTLYRTLLNYLDGSVIRLNFIREAQEIDGVLHSNCVVVLSCAL